MFLMFSDLRVQLCLRFFELGVFALPVLVPLVCGLLGLVPLAFGLDGPRRHNCQKLSHKLDRALGFLVHAAPP